MNHRDWTGKRWWRWRPPDVRLHVCVIKCCLLVNSSPDSEEQQSLVRMRDEGQKVSVYSEYRCFKTAISKRFLQLPAQSRGNSLTSNHPQFLPGPGSVWWSSLQNACLFFMALPVGLNERQEESVCGEYAQSDVLTRCTRSAALPHEKAIFYSKLITTL